MSNMSDYLENIVADHIFRTRTFTKPTTIYVGLFTVAPTDAGGGKEVTGNNYARVQVGPSDASWNGTHGTTTGNSSGTGGHIDNASAITFPVPTGGNWGTIVAVGIFDAVTSGNLIMWANLSVSKTVNNGDPAPYFAAGALDRS